MHNKCIGVCRFVRGIPVGIGLRVADLWARRSPLTCLARPTRGTQYSDLWVPGMRHRGSSDATADTIRPLVSGPRSSPDRDPHRCSDRDPNLTGGYEETAILPAPDPPAALDRAAVRAEMEQASHDFRQLISDATPEELRRPSDGTKWINQQLLFHMLFG